MAYGLFHATFIIYRTTPSHLAPSSTTSALFKVFLFLITRTLKQDDLATAFSTTSLTELEQNYSSGLVENNMCLFEEIPKYFYFVKVFFPLIKHRKQGSGNIKVDAPKFPPTTPVKAFPKFECNIYNTYNGLAFVNFSSPAWVEYIKVRN